MISCSGLNAEDYGYTIPCQLFEQLALKKELEELDKTVRKGNCDDRVFAKYRDRFKKIVSVLTQGAQPGTIQKRIQRKIARLAEVISLKCRAKIKSFSQRFPERFPERVNIRQDLLRSAFPQDAGEISDILKNIKLDCCEDENFTGKSLCFPFTICSGSRGVIKFRLPKGKPQVLVCRKIAEGGEGTIDIVATVAGPKIKNAPPIFARKSLREEHKSNPVRVEAMRRESEITQTLCSAGGKNILQYNNISEREGGTTLASVPYPTDLFEFLRNQFPDGIPPRAISAVISNIAIPIARALCSVHQQGFVHLDVKLENVLLSDTKIFSIKQAFLADFGACHEVYGTCGPDAVPFHLAPPELVKSQQKCIVTRAIDMWGFGLVLSAFLVGPARARIRVRREEYLSLLTPEQKLCFTSLPETKQNEYMHLYGVKKIEVALEEAALQFPGLAPLCDLAHALLSINPAERPTAEKTLSKLKDIAPSLPRNRGRGILDYYLN